MGKWYRPIATEQGKYEEHVTEWFEAYATREQVQTILDKYYPNAKQEIREEEISLAPFSEMLENKSLLSFLKAEDEALTLIRTELEDAPKYGVDVEKLARQKEKYQQARRDIKRYLVELLAEE